MFVYMYHEAITNFNKKIQQKYEPIHSYYYDPLTNTRRQVNLL